MRSKQHYAKIVPEGYRALMQLQEHVSRCGLEPRLLHLIALRASQINGCAFCLDLHTKEGLAAGDDPRRLALVAAFREASSFSERERAALAWVESITWLAESHAPDDVYEKLEAEFSEEEIVNLTFASALINAWNRMGVAFRIPPADR